MRGRHPSLLPVGFFYCNIPQYTFRGRPFWSRQPFALLHSNQPSPWRYHGDLERNRNSSGALSVIRLAILENQELGQRQEQAVRPRLSPATGLILDSANSLSDLYHVEPASNVSHGVAPCCPFWVLCDVSGLSSDLDGHVSVE